MDQVIERKKTTIIEKCVKRLPKNVKGFIMIEINISHNGKSNNRIVATNIDNKKFLNCALSILNRIQFKKIGPVTRIYRFFIH